MLKLLLQTTTLSILLLSPAFCMDPFVDPSVDHHRPIKYHRIDELTTEVQALSKDETLRKAKKCLDEGITKTDLADEDMRRYRDAKTAKKWNDRINFVKQSANLLFQLNIPLQYKNFTTLKVLHKERALLCYEEAATCFQEAIDLGLIEARTLLGVTYFKLIECDKKKYKKIAFKTLNEASDEGSEQAAAILEVCGKPGNF